MKWEYKIFYPGPILRGYSNERERDAAQEEDKRRAKILNVWGDCGWELVSFSETIAIFKRLVQQE